MKRFVVTGAPGAGKTAIIRQLELDGFGVVEEAATDVIALAHPEPPAQDDVVLLSGMGMGSDPLPEP